MFLGITMRVQLIALAIVLLIVPVISEYTQISGTYGEYWLSQSGNKHEFKQAQGLWSWGAVPKGHTLTNGKLVEDEGGMLISPAFPTSATPIVINATTPGRGINMSNQSSINPAQFDDPWTVAQTNDRPVLFRRSAY